MIYLANVTPLLCDISRVIFGLLLLKINPSLSMTYSLSYYHFVYGLYRFSLDKLQSASLLYLTFHSKIEIPPMQIQPFILDVTYKPPLYVKSLITLLLPADGLISSIHLPLKFWRCNLFRYCSTDSFPLKLHLMIGGAFNFTSDFPFEGGYRRYI